MKTLRIMVLAVLLASGERTPAQACPPIVEGELVSIEALTPAGDIRLADGRSLRLAGLAPLRGETERDLLAEGVAAWRGAPLRLEAEAASDRWGRLVGRARIVTGESGPAGDLASALLHGGFAWLLPERPNACLPAWRKAEAEARAARRGLWAGAGPALSGLDSAAVKAQAGQFVIIEGRIVSVGERRARTYLNFSRQPGAAGAVMLTPAQWRELKTAGWTARSLTGRGLRARGVVEGSQSLLVAPVSAAALEIVD